MDGGGGSGGAEIQYNSILDFTPKILKVYENDGVNTGFYSQNLESI